MKVVRHKTVRKDLKAGAGPGTGQRQQELLAVGGVHVYVLSAVSAGHRMINRTRKVDSSSPAHNIYTIDPSKMFHSKRLNKKKIQRLTPICYPTHHALG